MSGCAGLVGPESFTSRQWLQEIMSRMKKVNCNVAIVLHYSAVVDVLM